MKKLIQACVLVVCCLAPMSVVWAQTPSLKKGNYNGIWHTDKVKFDIEKVAKDGTFSGVIHWDAKGRYPNATAAFTGKIDPQGSIVIQRRDEWDQVSKAGAPKRTAKYWHWTGETTGKGLDKGYPFELKIPH